MLAPRKLKFRKNRKGIFPAISRRGTNLNFGQFGIKALSNAWLTAREIEAARRAITHYIRRGGKVWIRVFPDKPITAQPAETGMGGGKGSLDHFVVPVQAGRILFEIGGVSDETAHEALRLAGHKLRVKTKIIRLLK